MEQQHVTPRSIALNRLALLATNMSADEGDVHKPHRWSTFDAAEDYSERHRDFFHGGLARKGAADVRQSFYLVRSRSLT